MTSGLDEIKAEITKRFGQNVGFADAHISTIVVGDTVIHDGKIKTVCVRSISKDQFMGWMLFGDSYVLGRRPVIRLTGLRR